MSTTLHLLGWLPAVGDIVTPTRRLRIGWVSTVTYRDTSGLMEPGLGYVVTQREMRSSGWYVRVRKRAGARLARVSVQLLVPWDDGTR